MSEGRLIGKVSATEKSPSSCDEFQFWLSDGVRISPFDIVCVKNSGDRSVTYGVVQDILHITDGVGHMSNYVSSDFGDVEAEPMTKRLSLCFVKATVAYNSLENYMPVLEGSLVYEASAEDVKVALGLDSVPVSKAIPAGLLKSGNGEVVPVAYNSDFLIGPEGAHVNISGISGLATKTSYAMFLLKALQEKFKDDVAIIVMNVKGDDLLHIHEPNERIQDEQKEDWTRLGLSCTPFDGVKYFYPYKRSGSNAHTALSSEDLNLQRKGKRAFNYIYTFDHDLTKLDMLFAAVDDPNWTIESILNYVETSADFQSAHDWDAFKDVLKTYLQSGQRANQNREIPVQSWRRFSRLIKNSINNDVFVNAKSDSPRRLQVHLSDEIKNISAGEVFVVDIAPISEQLQCLVFGDVIRSVYELMNGDFDADLRNGQSAVPKKVIIFVDELNKYAPSGSGKYSPLLANLLDVTERGRSEGIILFSAEQFRSAVHDRIKGNCGTNVYGRTNAIEISKSDYRFVPQVYSNMMTRLGKGDLIVQHPVLKSLLKIRFPYPSYNQGGTEND